MSNRHLWWTIPAEVADSKPPLVEHIIVYTGLNGKPRRSVYYAGVSAVEETIFAEMGNEGITTADN